MNKKIPIYIYGTIILLEGIFLILSQQSSFKLIQMTLGISMTCVAVFAFVAAFIRQPKHVQFAYHELHASALLIYGLCILFLCNTLERLISFTNFLFIFYAFSEIIFCYWLLNLAQKLVTKIVLVRVKNFYFNSLRPAESYHLPQFDTCSSRRSMYNLYFTN